MENKKTKEQELKEDVDALMEYIKDLPNIAKEIEAEERKQNRRNFFKRRR